ncbi:MAG: glycogen/starch synthase, partial [Romboutsia sp.]|nr:glycogen/starch synthase [Romboutsia sp.]
MIASECSPFLEVSEVADVVSNLSKSLKKSGVDVDVVIPYYAEVDTYLNKHNIEYNTIANARLSFKNIIYSADIIHAIIPNTNVNIYFINEPNLISNGGIYFDSKFMESEDDLVDRFIFFSKAVLEVFVKKQLTNKSYDIIHCHNWQTGIIIQLNEVNARTNPEIKKPKTLFTIHNLAKQGFSKIEVLQKLYIDLEADKRVQWHAKDANILYTLQSIIGADFITTTSNTYANEIQTEQFGEGLHELLIARKEKITGILNGIDTEKYNPETEKFIYQNYNINNYRTEKYKNRTELLKELKLAENNKPIVAIVSKLTHKNGTDLIIESLENITSLGFSVIILGNGEQTFETKLSKIAIENENIYFSSNYSTQLGRK